MNTAELVLLTAATTSLTRLMTHDTVTAPLRDRVLTRGAERTVFTVDRPDGPRWEPVPDASGANAAWHRRPAWYARMLACSRFCAPMWAGAAVAVLWSSGRALPRVAVTALGLRGLHATAWPVIGEQFEDA